MGLRVMTRLAAGGTEEHIQSQGSKPDASLIIGLADRYVMV